MSNFIKFKDNQPDRIMDTWNKMLEEVCSSYFLPGEKKKVCVDIGANIGAFMGFALEEDRFEKVYGYEPAFQTYHTALSMLRNFKLLREDVQVRNFAVTEQSGQVLRLFGDESGESGNTSLIRGECHAFEETCMTISLDDIFTLNGVDYIDYLKMDCEGAEYNILYGCKRLEDVGIISLEVHHGMMDNIKNLLMQKGFWVMGFKSPDDGSHGDLLMAVNIQREDVAKIRDFYAYDEYGARVTIGDREKVIIEKGGAPLNFADFAKEWHEKNKGEEE